MEDERASVMKCGADVVGVARNRLITCAVVHELSTNKSLTFHRQRDLNP